MMYDLSIIVPIYNVEKYLDQTIQSVLHQREYNYEVILVNDGSMDGCEAICKKYQNENPDKIKLITKENGGLPSARKAGVRAAQGKYITFLDGDDWIDEDYYYQMVMAAKKNKAEVVCGSHCLSYPDKDIKEKNGIDTGVYIGEDLEEVKKRILYNRPYYTYGIYPSLCMKIIQKDLLEKYIYNVPDNVTIAEDAACSFPLLFACSGFVMLNENAGYHYRQIETSIMKRYDAKKITKVLTVMDYLEIVFASYYDCYGAQIDKYYTQLIKELVKNELLGDASYRDKVEKIKMLTEKDYVIRALRDLRGISVFYSIFFRLIRNRKFVILNCGYRLYKKWKS